MQQSTLFNENIDHKDVNSVKEFGVTPIERGAIKGFIEKWHYSHNTNGLKHRYCFAMFHKGEMIGAALLGPPATPGVAEAYSCNGTLDVVELRRLCCIDETPRNTESYFIGQMVKWLKRNTKVDVILSYSDKTYGHEGTIYKASNFTLVGESPASDKILYNGKLYHDKALRVYNGSKAMEPNRNLFRLNL